MPIDPALLAALPTLRTAPAAVLHALSEHGRERRYDAGATTKGLITSLGGGRFEILDEEALRRVSRRA